MPQLISSLGVTATALLAAGSLLAQTSVPTAAAASAAAPASTAASAPAPKTAQASAKSATARFESSFKAGFVPQPISFNKGCVKPDKTITLAAIGDVLLHDTLQQWAAAQPTGFLAAMGSLQDLLSGADVAVANLEGPAAAGVAPGGRKVQEPAKRYDAMVYKGYPMFNYHPSLVTDLQQLGVDVLQTANNHALDRGELGANLTLEAIDAAGLSRTGTRHSQKPEQPWFATRRVHKDGKDYNIAYLACSYSTNGVVDKARQVLMCYENKDTLLGQVKQLSAREDVHAVIVLPHWGQEYQPLPDQPQQQLARDLAEAGATAIIGTHPHVVQPMEKIRTRDGRETAVVYSLGNFVSHQVGLPRLSSLIYLLALAPGKNQKLEPQAVGWIPLRMKTGATFAIEAIERLPAGAAEAHKSHLLKSFPSEQMQPPQLPYWRQSQCP
jgi:poly-gamma-glutamate synthesis protein (capsule biosynthesis protein)